MSGERGLDGLLRSMQPVLHEPVYVFITLPRRAPVPKGLDPVMTFREGEGTTLIIARETAVAAGLDGIFPCRMITLNVHSSLEAVGFLAVITQRLAQAGMAVNPVSAFHHDHLFVPEERAEEALATLLALQAGGEVPQ
jgi:hypothetical protein